MRRGTLIALLLTGAVAHGCGGEAGSVRPDPDPPDPSPPPPESPPTVELAVGINRDDSARGDSLAVAEGESVILEWSTSDRPSRCAASGAWSGDKSPDGGEAVSAPLRMEKEYVFSLDCENNVGSDEDAVHVDVRSDDVFHARSDRKDESPANVHVIYAIAKDAEDRELDLTGRIETSIAAFRRWMREKTGGYDLIMDTYGGELDITFFRLETTEAEMAANTERTTAALISDALKRAGMEHYFEDGFGKVNLVYYDGEPAPPSSCGNGGGLPEHGGQAVVHIEFCVPPGKEEDPLWEDSPEEWKRFAGTGLHEVLHALGAVDRDAPNHNPENPKHVIDKSGDIMCSGPAPEGVDVVCLVGDRDNGFFDYGRDDYFHPDGGLPDDVANVAESPFVKP